MKEDKKTILYGSLIVSTSIFVFFSIVNFLMGFEWFNHNLSRFMGHETHYNIINWGTLVIYWVGITLLFMSIGGIELLIRKAKKGGK